MFFDQGFFFRSGILSFDPVPQFPTSPLINNPEQHKFKTLSNFS